MKKRLFLLPLMALSMVSCGNSSVWTDLKSDEVLIVFTYGTSKYYTFSNSSNYNIKYRVFENAVMTIDINLTPKIDVYEQHYRFSGDGISYIITNSRSYY